MKWNDVKYHILAVLDVYSRFEVNAIIDRETEEMEIKVLEQQWFQGCGPPERFAPTLLEPV